MPQVQFIDQPNIGSALGKFGEGFLGEYTENLKRTQEEDALQNILSGITPDMSEEDVLKEVMGGRGIKQETKKSVLDLFSQAKSRAHAAKMASEKVGREERKFGIQTEQKERELDIRQQAAGTKKGDGLSSFEKKRQTDTAKTMVELENQIPKIHSSMRTADEVGKLIEETLLFGTLNPRKQAELRVNAATLLEPMIKIYNPTGQLPKSKLEWITDKFMIKGTELRGTQRGKLAGIKSLLREQESRIKERLQMIESWNGNPPFEELVKFDNESESIFDEISGYSEYEKNKSMKRGDAVDAPHDIQEALKNADKSKTVTGKGGKKYRWQEDKWVQF